MVRYASWMILATVIALLWTMPCSAATQRITISFYFGASQTRPSDLHVVQQERGNDATMHEVSWQGYPFRFEPYYGIRLTYTPPGTPQSSIAIDFTHYKIYGRTEDVVTQDGTWHGSPLASTATVNQRVQSFDMTHGLNMLGVSILQQLSASQNGVYIGAGPVIYMPHTESRVDGLPGPSAYHFGGWGFQSHTGVRECISGHSVFGEIKYNEGHPVVPIAQGQASLTLQTFHELLGLGFGRC